MTRRRTLFLPRSPSGAPGRRTQHSSKFDPGLSSHRRSPHIKLVPRISDFDRTLMGLSPIGWFLRPFSVLSSLRADLSLFLFQLSKSSFLPGFAATNISKTRKPSWHESTIHGTTKGNSAEAGTCSAPHQPQLEMTLHEFFSTEDGDGILRTTSFAQYPASSIFFSLSSPTIAAFYCNRR